MAEVKRGFRSQFYDLLRVVSTVGVLASAGCVVLARKSGVVQPTNTVVASESNPEGLENTYYVRLVIDVNNNGAEDPNEPLITGVPIEPNGVTNTEGIATVELDEGQRSEEITVGRGFLTITMPDGALVIYDSEYRDIRGEHGSFITLLYSLINTNMMQAIPEAG